MRTVYRACLIALAAIAIVLMVPRVHGTIVAGGVTWWGSNASPPVGWSTSPSDIVTTDSVDTAKSICAKDSSCVGFNWYPVTYTSDGKPQDIPSFNKLFTGDAYAPMSRQKAAILMPIAADPASVYVKLSV